MNFIIKILLKALTTKLAKKVLIILLKKMAERTDNKIDDEIVKVVIEALSEI